MTKNFIDALHIIGCVSLVVLSLILAGCSTCPTRTYSRMAFVSMPTAKWKSKLFSYKDIDAACEMIETTDHHYSSFGYKLVGWNGESMEVKDLHCETIYREQRP